MSVKMPVRPWCQPIVAILLVYLVLAMAYSVTIPLGEAPDEVSHYAYISELVRQRHFPAPEGAAIGEAHQPPLYYLLTAALIAWIPNQEWAVQSNPDFSFDDPATPNLLLHPRAETFPYQPGAWAWHLIRALSAVLGAITVWATYRLALELLPADRAVALGAATFLAFLPSFLIISAAVNNDNLIIALSTLTLWQWVRILKRTPGISDGLLLGALLGLAALTKITGLLLWAAIASSFLPLLRERATRWQWIRLGAVTFALALLFFGPWVLFDSLTYADPFAWSRFRNVNPRLDPLTWADLQTYAVRMYWSFWGKFGGASHIRLPDIAYALLSLLPLLALPGLVQAGRAWREGRLSLTMRYVLGLFAVFEIALLASHIRLMTFTLGMDQARHVFAGLGPLAIGLVWGITRLMRNRAVTAAILGVGMAGVGAATLVLATATYAPPAQNLGTLPVLDHRQSPADFGDQIRIADYRLEQTRVSPGGEVAVLVYWQALREPAEVYWLRMQLSGPAGSLAGRDGVPANGRTTTDRWQAGQVLVSRHVLPVPPDVAAGTYRLELGLHPAGRWQWLPVQGGEMLTLGAVEVRSTQSVR